MIVAWIIFVLGLFQYLGDTLDFAVREWRLSERARTSSDQMEDEHWGDNAVYSAMAFAQLYLKRIFGARWFSPRVFAISIFVSLIVTILIVDQLVPNRVLNVSWFIVLLAVVNGVINGTSLGLARMTMHSAVQHGKQAAIWQPLLVLCAIAYLAMGVAWSEWNILAVLLLHQDAVDQGTLALEVFFWLPGLAVIRKLNIAVATFPGALTTVVLIFNLAVPAGFVKTKRLWKRPLISALRRFASIPPWTF